MKLRNSNHCLCILKIRKDTGICTKAVVFLANATLPVRCLRFAIRLLVNVFVNLVFLGDDVIIVWTIITDFPNLVVSVSVLFFWLVRKKKEK